jgi:hypothetical protein
LPGEPERRKIRTKSASGVELEQHSFVVGIKTTAYLISYQDDANLVNAGARVIARALDNARDVTVAILKGKLKAEKSIKFAGYPGREIQIETPKLGIYRARVYVVGKRLYQVVVLGPEKFALSRESSRYLDSFKLTK